MIKINSVNWIDLKDGKIEMRDVEIPSEADAVIDGAGKYMMPGLVDMHTHISPLSAKHYLASGVTSIRNTGGNYELIQVVDDVAPNTYATYRFIDGNPGLWGPTSYGTVSTNDRDTAVEAVEELHDQGAKFIKVYGNIQADVLEAVAEKGEALGLEVAADLLHTKSIDAMKAAEYGVKWLEHASSIIQHLFPGYHTQLSDEDFAAIAGKPMDEDKLKDLLLYLMDKGVKIVPTLTLYRHLAEGRVFNPPELDASRQMKLLGSDEMLSIDVQFGSIDEQINKELRKRQKWEYEQVKRITEKYLEMGGEVYIGTDAPAGTWVYPGLSMVEELNAFRDFGLNNFEILKKATIEAKKVVGEDEGYILLNNNPIERLENILDINTVLVAGKVFTWEEITEHQVDGDGMREVFESLEAKYN
ncbi:amidohydrolase family protein [Salinicoccus roseus]|uniref:amidohydrolase family protein n=1 Tax=Salinicoccus roseus TaxID=45670 RepID=UPI003DA13194